MQTRILILSDSKWRDSFGHALLAYELTQLGHQVKMFPFDLFSAGVNLFKPHVVILNHIHGKRNKAIASHVKRQGGLVVVSPTEGRPNSKLIEDWFFSQIDSPDLDLYLSWNDIVTGDKTVTVGCPRFDIYREYKSLIDSRELFCDKYNLDPSRKIAGITSSFPQAKFAYRDSSFNRNDWKDLGISSIDGFDADDYAVDEWDRLKKFKLKILWNISANPDYQFILKPHPMESDDMWEGFCAENGITLIRQEYAFNFINAVDFLIARAGCVTVQDAWMLGKHVNQIVSGDILPGAASEAVIDSREHEKVQEYLDKYGYLIESSAKKSALAVDSLIASREPSLVEEPTVKLLSNMNLQISQFEYTSMANPNRPYQGKSVLQRDVSYWLDRIGGCNDK